VSTSAWTPLGFNIVLLLVYICSVLASSGNLLVTVNKYNCHYILSLAAIAYTKSSDADLL